MATCRSSQKGVVPKRSRTSAAGPMRPASRQSRPSSASAKRVRVGARGWLAAPTSAAASLPSASSASTAAAAAASWSGSARGSSSPSSSSMPAGSSSSSSSIAAAVKVAAPQTSFHSSARVRCRSAAALFAAACARTCGGTSPLSTAALKRSTSCSARTVRPTTRIWPPPPATVVVPARCAECAATTASCRAGSSRHMSTSAPSVVSSASSASAVGIVSSTRCAPSLHGPVTYIEPSRFCCPCRRPAHT
mmetsp:Transcript_2282/g.7411  ORF Transcript_2282/g.7411 Transcript_2282/m.7411 type:complete len:249 (-) Transcript_2282:517-1263(-)